VEHPLQLAFAHVDRRAALDERIEDLLSQATSHLPADHVRALYFANEALELTKVDASPGLQLRALRLMVDAMEAAGRAAEAAPYIVRAIDLADSIADADLLSSLVESLGAWAVAVEQDVPDDTPRRTSSQREDCESPQANTMPQPSLLPHGVDDPETGLMNAIGLAAELLSIEERQIGYALIQVIHSDHIADQFVESARVAAEFVGDRGLVARNGVSLLTAVLPGFTGIAAMSLAEHIRRAVAGIVAGTEASVGIGVAIKQPGETSRDLLRRVADRAEEAGRESGVAVAG
jgi:GGDEF domain-containing protein